VPQIINTNIMSLTAQYALDTSQSALNTSMTRLSTGLRINSAADDPAGYAISQQMTSQVNGMSQAGRNANNAVSLLQTGQGALTQITDNLQNIRELAVEAADATNSATDRAALNQQVQQDLSQVDQIASTTQFNGQNILDGTFGSATFQVGANVGNTDTVNLSTSMRTAAIGQVANYVGGTTYSAALAVGQQGAGVNGTGVTTGNLSIQVGSGTATAINATVAGTQYGTGTISTAQSAGSAYAIASAINASGVAGVTATANTTVALDYTTTTSASYSLKINGTAIETGAAAGLTGEELATAINGQTSATGVEASFAGGAMTLTAADGSNITILQTDATGTDGLQGSAGVGVNNSTNQTTFAAAPVSGTAITAVGSVQLISNSAITLTGSDSTSLGFTATSYALGNKALNSADVSTVNDANSTISAVNAALSTVNNLAAQLGALQNRFESTISNLQSGVQNITAARSTIQDADFAAETANMTRAQILQQAGTAILAQANNDPQNVLSLLKG
jgi:flagellin